MKTTHKRRRAGFTLVELLVVIIIIASLAALAYPQVLKARKKADATQATNNARQIGGALFEFDNEYSSYPDSTTAQSVLDQTGSTLNLSGNSANDMFRQLIAAGMMPSEEVFYAKTPYTKKPDNVYNTGAKALEAGECGFGYLMNGNSAFSTAGNSRPIVVTPLLNAQSDGSFDPDPFDYKAIVLHTDNSVKQLNIRQNDKRVVLGNKTLTDTGDDTVWGSNVQNVSIVAPIKKN